MAGFPHDDIDAKWQARWAEHDTFATPTDRTKPKYYVLDMFPYPSGSGLHVGHPKGYVATDVVARAKRMMGFNVLHAMGWDSFGLPAERQAVLEGKHPRDITARNIKTFKQQLTKLGLSYDWNYEFATSDSSFYHWTQWIFLKLHEKGLAYQAEAPVNWCPALGTVLANEEVVDGKYIETGDPVERRMMKQWMLRITEYADRLIDGLEDLDWPESTLKRQRDWIGRSVGADVTFGIDGRDESIDIFTTRPDTLWGCTYLVLAPEHSLVAQITADGQRPAVEAYVEEVGNRTERDRTTDANEAPKTGVFTGAFAVNPVNGEKVPIWIADYVLTSYGTGAVFACPAHDQRDYAFAKTFGLPIVEVVRGGNIDEAAYTGDGEHLNSEFLDHLEVAAAKEKICSWLEERGVGKASIRYRLRDWLFSRQRYWGEPFPIIELDDGTVKVLPETALPIELPELDEYKPTDDGKPPLAGATEWVNTIDPQTGAPALRETNTMPQWAGSCWYYLRFTSPKSEEAAWDPKEEKYWMPVDLYVGGNEHATLHLLYARFWHKVLYDMGLVSTPEPFKRLFHQGMIHHQSFRDDAGKWYHNHQVEQREGIWFATGTEKRLHTKIEKMSKSRYNVVNPDDMCAQYGADALRLYELFMGPLEDGPEWDDTGVAGTRRFLDRTWRIAVDPESGDRSSKIVDGQVEDANLERALHAAIKKVSDAIDSLRFNTAISEMMVFASEATRAKAVPKAWFEQFVLILSPFAPHVAEEIWARLGNTESLAFEPWPAFDESKLATETITLVVQVSGKRRATIEVPADISKEDALAAAKMNANVAKYLEGKTLKREIFVPGRLVNLVAV